VRFLSKLEEYCERDNQSVIAYCLMDNHYHLALQQKGQTSLSHTMRSLLVGYVKAYNHRYATAGVLFQGRFMAKQIDNPLYNPWHLARVTRYIHRNPLPFADLRTYLWSSYRQFMGEAPGICEIEQVMELFLSKDDYAIFVAESPSYDQGDAEAKYRVVGGRRIKNSGISA
jgi:putative transposase